MAGKTGLRPESGFGNAGRRPDGELGQVLLTVIGIGLAGGIALVGGAVKLGEKMLDLQVKAYERIEAEREARRETVRKIAENEIGFPEEAKNEELQSEE